MTECCHQILSVGLHCTLAVPALSEGFHLDFMDAFFQPHALNYVIIIYIPYSLHTDRHHIAINDRLHV